MLLCDFDPLPVLWVDVRVSWVDAANWSFLLKVKYALISAQRCMICQGDIARYREQANDTANYGKARRYCCLFVTPLPCVALT